MFLFQLLTDWMILHYSGYHSVFKILKMNRKYHIGTLKISTSSGFHSSLFRNTIPPYGEVCEMTIAIQVCLPTKSLSSTSIIK